MKSTQVAVIGAGPAGLAAAIEVARVGGRVTVIDENARPGGQLFKQIHKFFGSREHCAGVRGFEIGEQLLAETRELNVDVLLDSPVYALFPDKTIAYIHAGKEACLAAEKIIIATGAAENPLAFPGSTLPGVMGAGAAQTMINVHRVLPGKRILMVGSGNVGLIVAYQLLQAGADVTAVIEAAPQIGGYAVHAAKIRRAGVPIYLSHTVKRARGEDQVKSVEIVKLDSRWQPVAGSEKILAVDTACLAVGLTPLAELAWVLGCEFVYLPGLGGHVPKHDWNLETTVPGIYIAGDISGVEEASTAMEEGRLAGVACAEALGFLNRESARERKEVIWERLNALRTGPFGERRRKDKNRLIGLSTVRAGMKNSVAFTGIPDQRELRSALGRPSRERLDEGPVAFIECDEEIPCNPCEEACPFGAIVVGQPMTNLPVLHGERCTGCGQCIAPCPGLAIFKVHLHYTEATSLVEFPWEYRPLPSIGAIVPCVDRKGDYVTDGRVLRVNNAQVNDGTAVIAVEVPKPGCLEVRGLSRKETRRDA